MKFTCLFDGQRFETTAASPSKAANNLAFKISKQFRISRRKVHSQITVEPVQEKTPSQTASGAFLNRSANHTTDMSDTQQNNGPDFIVYAEKDLGGRKTRLFPIGAAFRHGKGDGLNIQLDSVPLGGFGEGRLTLFPPKSRTERPASSSQPAFAGEDDGNPPF